MMTQRDKTLPNKRLPIFIFEPNEAARSRAKKASIAAGYDPTIAATREEAAANLEAEDFVGVLLADGEAAVELGQYVREFTSIDAPLAVIVDSDAIDPATRVSATGADIHLRRPVTASNLELFLGLGEQLLDLRRQKTQVPESSASLRKTTRTGFHAFNDVKDLLVVEVRRAKRYGYPLSILLVRLDPIPALQELGRPNLPREITAGLASAIARSLRVIDLPIHYAEDSILVFLPHTDLAGAEEVGRRVKRRIKRITYRDEELVCQVTASVGVAGISAGDNLSFARLIKAATTALRAAQLKGGDRVMKRVNSNLSSGLSASEIFSTSSGELAVDEGLPTVKLSPPKPDEEVGQDDPTS